MWSEKTDWYEVNKVLNYFFTIRPDIMKPKIHSKHAAASITLMALLLLTGIFPFSSATAEPIDLNGSIPLGAGSISGALHGDLAKNILTLNSFSPGSKISVNTAASGPLPPGILQESFTYTKNYSFGDSLSYKVEFIITPHLSANLIVPTWNFNIGGSANLRTGTVKLAAAPQSPSAIGTINAISMPTFSGKITSALDPVAAALAQAALDSTLVELNSSGAKLKLNLTSKWEKLSIGSATMALIQKQPDIRINLDLASAILSGKFDYKVDLSFATSSEDFIGNVFEEEIESLIEDELMSRLLSYVDSEFDREGNGKFGKYRQDCSSRQLGPTRIGASCNANAQFILGSGLLHQI